MAFDVSDIRYFSKSVGRRRGEVEEVNMAKKVDAYLGAKVERYTKAEMIPPILEKDSIIEVPTPRLRLPPRLFPFHAPIKGMDVNAPRGG